MDKNNSNPALIAVIIFLVVLIVAGAYCFTIWQKKKSKAGYVDQDSLLSAITAPIQLITDDFSSLKYRNDKVVAAQMGAYNI